MNKKCTRNKNKNYNTLKQYILRILIIKKSYMYTVSEAN